MPRGKFNFKVKPDEKTAFIGSKPVYPHVMIKKLWKHIKENNLMVADVQ